MSNELAVIAQQPGAVSLASNFMPVFDFAQAIQRHNLLVEFTRTIMHPGIDYGSPGNTAGKPSLLKPGAEKLSTFFGLVPEYVTVSKTEDWTGKDHGGEPFFYYHLKCRLTRNGQLIGEGEGSCNTWESKYRYRWVREDYAKINGLNPSGLVKRGGRVSEFDFAIKKEATTGKYGKPPEYWNAFKEAIQNGKAVKVKRPMGKDGELSDAWEIDAIEYRIPNPDVSDQVNTCLKMAMKRSHVAAVLTSVNASEFFTQDLEDLEIIDLPAEAIISRGAAIVDVGSVTSPQQPKPAEPIAQHATVVNAAAPAAAQPNPAAIPRQPSPADPYMATVIKEKGGIRRVFSEIYGDLLDALGNNFNVANQKYSDALLAAGVEDLSQFTSTGPVRQAILQLLSDIEEAKKMVAA